MSDSENQNPKKTEKNPSKYKQLSMLKKVEILKRFENGDSISNIANEFGIHRSSVYYTIKKKEVILKRVKVLEDQHGDKKRTKLYGVEDTPVEKCLYQWFLQKRSLGEPVNGPILREKALIFHEKLGNSSPFVASEGWLIRFKDRHGIREWSNKGEKLSNSISTSLSFRFELQEIVEKNGIKWENVYNAGEAGLAYKALPTKTVVSKKKEALGRKIARDRVTMLTCANATGTHKVSLYLIGKYKNPRCFQNIAHLPIHYRAQANAWMDKSLFLDWYEAIFLPEVKARGNEGDKFLLLLDNVQSHPSAEALNSIDPSCTVIFLPHNATARIQPMGQGVIVFLKRAYREFLLRRLLYEDHVNKKCVETFIKKWNLLDCCRTLVEAWNSVNENVATNAWRQLYVRSILDPDPENPGVEDIRRLANAIYDGIDFTENDIHAWIKCDDWYPVFYVKSDDDIVQGDEFVCPTEEEELENEQNDEAQQVPDPSFNDAFLATDTLIRWFSKQPNYQEEFLEALRKMNIFLTKDISNKLLSLSDISH